MPTAEAPPLPEIWLPESACGRYKTVAELTDAISRKATPIPGRWLYTEDGTVEVTEIEEALSPLTIPGQRHNVVVVSGMTAVSGAVRFALDETGIAARGKPPTLAYAPEAYRKSTGVLNREKNKGVPTVGFYTGRPETIDALFEDGPPDVIFVETVTNTSQTAVLHIHNLLAKTRPLGEDGPIVVADTTVAQRTGFDFNKILLPSDRWILVQSITKGMLLNSGHGGLVSSPNVGLMDRFRKFKAGDGLVTSNYADPIILRIIEATAPGFHERNRALYASAGKLAVALAEAQQELGSDSDFSVGFPTLPNHPNHAYATEHYPNGVSPVVFMGCMRFEEDSAEKLLKRIVEHPSIKEQIKEGQIFMGQSFGFKEARLLYDLNASQVRVAGGYGIDSPALADALYEAAADV